MSSTDLQYLLAMAGTVAFSVTAVCAVTPKGIDLFGACVLGLITAIGGGTIRDVILDVPVFWAEDLNYVWVALVSSSVAFYTNRLMTRKSIYKSMLYLDALGVSMFAIQAAYKVQWLDFAMPFGPILLGIITAIGGGLLRDVLAGNSTLLMRKELYAIPVMVGCMLYTIMLGEFPDRPVSIGVGCAVLIFVIRAAAIHWNLSVPIWLCTQAKDT